MFVDVFKSGGVSQAAPDAQAQGFSGTFGGSLAHRACWPKIFGEERRGQEHTTLNCRGLFVFFASDIFV